MQKGAASTAPFRYVAARTGTPGAKPEPNVPQIIPNTIAARNANDMTAATTFSLRPSSIGASFHQLVVRLFRMDA